MTKHNDTKVNNAVEHVEYMTEETLRGFNRVAETAKGAAEDLGATVGTVSSDLTNKAGKMVSDFGSKATEVTESAGKRVREQPWLMVAVALVLVLALGATFGRRYFAEM